MTSEMKQGAKQALGLSVYCASVGTLMNNGNLFFGKQDTFITPIFALTLFCVSALICSLIVFKYPYELFFSGKKKEALNVVVYTAVSLLLVLLLLFFIMYILNTF